MHPPKTFSIHLFYLVHVFLFVVPFFLKTSLFLSFLFYLLVLSFSIFSWISRSPSLFISVDLVAGIWFVFFISFTRCLFNQIIYCYILCHLILLLIFLNYGKLINIHLDGSVCEPRVFKFKPNGAHVRFQRMIYQKGNI